MRDLPGHSGPMCDWSVIELLPGAVEALRRLTGSYTLCVASNALDSDAERMGRALRRGEIRRFFDHLWTSHELGFRKPDPRFFGEAARRLGLKPASCVAVGNDPIKDIAPAAAAGMRTVWLREETGHRPIRADWEIRGLIELPETIAGIDIG